MTKVVINKCYGGFGLSDKAIKRFFELKEWTLVIEKANHGILDLYYYKDSISDDNFFHDVMIERDDPVLIQVVEELGKESFGQFAKLKVVEIPDGVDWEIEEYDGTEWIAEVHRTWG